MANELINEPDRNVRQQPFSLGENIRRKRMEQNISQEFLAEKLSISRQSVSKWENGLSEPSSRNLAQLAALFHCRTQELLGEETQIGEDRAIPVVGIAISPGDIRKLKCFFQEMPSDILDCRESSFLISCGKAVSEKRDLAAMVEKYSGHSVLSFLPGEQVQPGKIYLVDSAERKESFDQFFTSLAQEYGKNAVAVFFSGWGKDGMKGIRQVKDAGGLTVLCETEKKDKDNRYWKISDSHLFDYILEPVNMGYWIAGHIRRWFFYHDEKYNGVMSSNLYFRVQECVKKVGVLPLADIKEEIFVKALLECFDSCGLSSLDEYGRFLEGSAEEQQKMKQNILKHFCARREDSASLLRLKDIIMNINPEFSDIRIWVAGCGSGLDAYVIAMMLADYMENNRWRGRVKLFATDVDEGIVSAAIQGRFSSDDIKSLPDIWKKKYFQQTEADYQVNQAIRNMITFSVHDVLTSPPFSKLDLLICRNVLQKFRIRSRKNVIARFSYALNPNGYLVLGQGEDIDALSLWFENVEEYSGRVWEKKKSAPFALNKPIAQQERFSVGKVVNDLLAAVVPSCIIIDERHEILYTGQEAGRYLHFKAGEFSKNLFDNIDRELGVLIDMALKYLQQEDKRQELTLLNPSAGSSDSANIHVLRRVIKDQSYYLIWFDALDADKNTGNTYEIAPQKEKKLRQELNILQANLSQTMNDLDNTRERYEIINEKLQSSNEELTLMNDELQVLNQELSASNRRLTRTNSEYQEKLNEMPDFLRDGIDFFKLMELQAIFLDKNFCIRKMSAEIPDITHVKKDDLGRNISTLIIMNGYLGWQDDVKAARSGRKTFRVLNDVSGKRYFVQILPYFLAEDSPTEYVILIQTINERRSDR